MATAGDYERKRYHAHGITFPRRSVAASDDTWRIYMNCGFPGPTATRCCFYLIHGLILEPGKGPKRHERCCCSSSSRYQIFENPLKLSQYATDRKTKLCIDIYDHIPQHVAVSDF